MSFLTEISKNQSEKASYVRLSPKENISVSSIGSNLYTATTTRNVFAVFASGSELISAASPDADGEYSYDSSSGLITVYSSASISSIIIQHYVYLSEGKNRGNFKNLDSLAGDVIEWAGRLKEDPSFSQELQDINSGIISITPSSIQIFNYDGAYSYLMSRLSSVYRCEFSLWISCNSEVEKIFTGLMLECSMSDNILTISTSDNLEILKQPCYMGDSEIDSTINDTKYSILNRDSGKIIQFLSGRVSPYSIGSLSYGLSSTLNSESLMESFCIDASSTISTNTNRSWVCFRSSDIFSGFIECEVSYVGDDYTLEVADSSDFMPLDKVKIGTTYFKIDSILNSTTILATRLTGPSISGTLAITYENIPFIMLVIDDVSYEPIIGVHYDIESELLSSGNSVFSIKFKDNFEAGFSISALDPSKSYVFYRGRSTKKTHAQIIEEVVSSSGLNSVINYLDFSQTESSIMIPESNGSMEEFLSIIEKICRSNSSYIFSSNDASINYGEFSTPSSGDEFTDSDIINGSLSISENSRDISSRIRIFYKFINSPFINYQEVYSPETESLIGSVSIKEITSVNYSDAVPAGLILQNLTKTNTYRFKLKTKGYDKKIGDFIKVSGSDLIITGIEKGVSGVTITAIDTFTG